MNNLLKNREKVNIFRERERKREKEREATNVINF
jgi:hypothetical protein